MNPVFVDTNIFMYACGGKHPHKEPSIKFLLKIAENKVLGAINSEVLQEILYRYWKINDKEAGLQVLEKVVVITPIVLPVAKKDVLFARDLLKKYSSIEPRDAIHAATCFNHGITTICSYDKHFDSIKEIKRSEP